MSHFTKLKIQIKDRELAMRIAEEKGWKTRMVQSYKNHYSEGTVKEALVFSDGDKDKLVIGQDGSVTVDPYYMGREYEQFMQDYDVAALTATAEAEGGWVSEETEQQDGSIILKVTLP